MTKTDIHTFDLLKKAISATFLQNHSASKNISDWKGEDIVLFQEDLFTKTKAKVSEKWFYTYFKNTPEKLPRIDMLNMLSQYVGFDNWAAFKQAHEKQDKKKFKKGLIYSLGGVIIILIFLAYINLSENTFEFCFYDEDKETPITNIALDIKILQDNESPVYLKTDSSGCFSYSTKQDHITFVVQSPFHKTDTIVRYKNTSTNPIVKLSTDDYALMLNYYSNNNIKDIRKRQSELRRLINDDAIIYQLFKNNLGIEIYTKEEFIQRLTTPTSELKRINIVSKNYKNGRIVKLKFIVE